MDLDIASAQREEISTQELTDSVYEFQNEDLRKQVAALKSYTKHLRWHCYIYRKALAHFPNGMEILEAVEKEVGADRSPPCSSCEKDELLQKLQQLENEVQRKRKRDADSDSEA
ncbi:uncharacterized protein LOC113212541 [Frankliniella occidentalis]|uniref:Uncharacterized protein LOC113212541 n=1 Tax=Frankliniella occidentalis TaxID=133901 RepID=A0A6J1T256_FRAOC|nr:uncharacterized protein LOC113212541 [Frankliniella occidentalis]XP_026287069.1 uncharacterized protein LOC113212541 [Frankliniella occidentalis]XP_026287070.1 uncharacterized protein LOC113212541 [Frankliniella occidentalis]